MISHTTSIPTVDQIADALRPSLLRLARELRRETEQLGVTSRQAAFLAVIEQSPGTSPRELAAREGITAPSLSGHLDRLEHLGLVRRTRDQDDRRRVGVVVTPAGERFLRRIRARRTTWLSERLAGLEPDELASIARALPALHRLTGP
jgi:DNA-binding MarR family transcriptional regulator